MVKVSVLYPSKPGTHFDADYYLNVHMPMAVRLLGAPIKATTAEIGISGEAPASPAPFAAIACFTCDSVEAFGQAFMPIADQLQADIPNYTDIEPMIQISSLSTFTA